jgi:hypothetical protein
MPRHRRRSNKSNRVVEYALLSLVAGSMLYVLSNKAKRDCEDSVKEKIVQFMVEIGNYGEKTKKFLMKQDVNVLIQFITTLARLFSAKSSINTPGIEHNEDNKDILKFMDGLRNVISEDISSNDLD